MKRIVIIFLGLFTMGGFAQIEVTSNGDVGVGTTTSTLDEKFVLKGGNFYFDNAISVEPYVYWNSNKINFKSKTNAIGVLALRASQDWASRLDIYDAGDTNVNVRVRANGTSFFNGGRVGFGITAPQTDLHLASGVFQVGLNTDEYWSQLHNNRLVFNRASRSYIDFVNDANSLTFRQGSTFTPIMHLDASGFVGVGVDMTNPSEALHVAGSVLINQDLRTRAGEGFRLLGNKDYFGPALDGIIFRMEDTNQANGNTDGGFVFEGHSTTDGISQEWMVIRTPGNVGIGTPTPSRTLEVAGDVAIGDTSINFGSLLFRPNGTGVTGYNGVFEIESSTTPGAGTAQYLTRFRSTTSGTGGQTRHDVVFDGNVRIGTTDTFTQNFAVNGNATFRDEVSASDFFVYDFGSTSIGVMISPWPDYVFKDDYELLPLNEVEKHIKEKGHLPNVPSEKEVKEQGGFSLGEMNKKLLEKVEELMLYTIQQEKRIKALEEELTKRKK